MANFTTQKNRHFERSDSEERNPLNRKVQLSIKLLAIARQIATPSPAYGSQARNDVRY